MEEEIMASKIKNPPPKTVSLYNATSFGSNAPTNTPIFEYDASGPMDFLRYRMNRIWNKSSRYNARYNEGDKPLMIGNERITGNPAYLNNGITERYPSGFGFKNQEKVTITYNLPDIDACGTDPEPGIADTKNKWLKILENGQGLTTYGDAPLNYGIISTFADGKLRNGPTPISFYDEVFKYDAPLEASEIAEGLYGSLSITQASVIPNYNFYIQTYESILTQEDPSKEPAESMLPSLYSFLSVMENENNKRERASDGSSDYDSATIDTVFEKHITLKEQIKETRVATQVLYTNGPRALTTEADVSKGDYFDKYAYAFSEAVKDNAVAPWDAGTNPLSDRFKHQIVPSSNSQMFAEFSDVRKRFPMVNDMQFSTAPKSAKEVVRLFEDTEMTAMFIRGFVDGTWGSQTTMGYNLIASGGLPFIPDPTTYTETAFKPYVAEAAQLVPSSSLQCWDLLGSDGWLTQLNNIDQYYGQTEKGVFLGKYDQEIEEAQHNLGSRMTRNLMLTAFKARLKNLIQTKTRTWLEIVGDQRTGYELEPKMSHHETIFYVVEKWSADEAGNPIGTEPLQNFYFPNSTSFRDYKFSDTQVKYGKKYIYRIYSMEMVFGTKYSYTLNRAPTANSRDYWDKIIYSNEAQICVFTEPSLKMVKIPYYQKEVLMMDDPPVFPDVEVVTYQNVRDQIVFWMTGNSGDYKLNPIAIQPDDARAIRQLRTSQEVGPLEPIRFKSDDHARFFEVFRTDQKPSNYSDFIGKKIAHIDTKMNLNDECQFSTSAEWPDKSISPNIKYYYIFRTIDNHGHFSNPSPVYELEMVYDGYAPYLLRNVYPLDGSQSPPQTPSKKFTKYLHIKPALTQRVVDEVASGLVNSDGTKTVDTAGCLTNKGPDGNWIQLGTADQTLWDKLIKIRVRSTKTGKKIDFNIKFKKKHTKIENSGNNNLC